MPGQGRLGDKARAPLDGHSCPGCPHPASGPAIQGSLDVNVNGRPALRIGDPGIHSACCGTNTWQAVAGSQTVFINGRGAHRIGDTTRHCGGLGELTEGSPNVIVGEIGGARWQHAPRSPAATELSAWGAATAQPQAPAPHGLMHTAAEATLAGSDRVRAASAVEAQRAASPTAAPPQGSSAPPPEQPAAPALTWIEIVLIGEDDEPISGERYVLVPPDGAPRTGLLDDAGRARIEGLTPGTCEVGFPGLDADAWELLGA